MTPSGAAAVAQLPTRIRKRLTYERSRLADEVESTWRRREAKRLLRRERLTERIPPERAFLPVDAAGLPGFSSVAEYARELHRARLATGVPIDAHKDYFVPLLTRDSYRERPEILELGLDPHVVALVADYFGTLPLLRIAQIYWTPAQGGTAEEGSQLYHFDHDADKQVKLFANLVDVTPADGPFTFLPADVSANVAKRATADGVRYSDDDVYTHAEPGGALPLTGPVGTGMLVDTTRCMHFGARNHGNDRLLLVLQYVPLDIYRTPGPHDIDLREVDPPKGSARRRRHLLRRRFRQIALD